MPDSFITVGKIEVPSTTAIAKLMSSHRGRLIMAEENLIVSASEKICHYMEERGWSPNELARYSTVPYKRVIGFLRGKDITLRELARMAHTLGMEVSC